MEELHNMTQIKLRRDTSANFTSKNPVLGIGEPAYETDTKKLKIGDGNTAYNNLDYFSSGGSASFEVVQPLKMVDDTLTLQIDEQTIQVQDGKLVANLDELGNEVNTLAGKLAGVQADILNKQDKLTPKLPLKIDVVPDERVFGFTINTQNNQMRADAEQDQTMFFGVGQDNAINTNKVHSYVKIPYSTGQVLELPYKPTQYHEDASYVNRTAMLPGWFGHTNEDGTISPVVTASMKSNWSGAYYDQQSTYLFTSFENNAGVYTGKNSILCGEELGFNTGSASRPTVFVQINSATNSFDIQFPSGGYNNPDYTNYWTAGTTAFVAADYPTIDCFIYCPPGQESIDTNFFGLYNSETRLRNGMMGHAESNTNIFSFEGVDTQYLQLDIGSGLAITDGKLTASSTAPTNMVTTDTVQTISGFKTFERPLTLAKAAIGQVTSLQVPLYTESNTIILTPIVQSYTDFDTMKSTLRLGNDSVPLHIKASRLTTGANKTILTQANVTAGDNVTISQTSTGILISGPTNETLAASSLPSSVTEVVTVGASGATISMPFDGWFFFTSRVAPGTTQGIWCEIFDSTDTTKISGYSVANDLETGLCLFMPVSKGSIIHYYYNTTGGQDSIILSKCIGEA